MFDQLHTQISRIATDYRADREVLENAFQRRQLSKHEVLLDSNSICQHYYFLSSGAIRISFVNDGKEYTSWIAFEGYFFTELESYSNNTFSNYRMTAIEDTKLLTISRSKMEDLLEKYDWWRRFFVHNQQQTILKLTEAIQSFQTLPATARYESLVNHPAFLQKVRQKDLSSMIGITHHSLSRIRKKRR